MSVVSVKAQLATLQPEVLDSHGALVSGILGIKHAFAQVPLTLNSSDMPCMVNWTGPATMDWVALGDGMDIEARIYLMRLYVLPTAEGVSGEAERLCEPFFARVRDFFAARPMLGNLSGVQFAYVTGDSGVTKLVLNDPATPMIGIEFKLQVQEYIGFNYVE
jgi:hypothetical protein